MGDMSAGIHFFSNGGELKKRPAYDRNVRVGNTAAPVSKNGKNSKGRKEGGTENEGGREGGREGGERAPNDK